MSGPGTERTTWWSADNREQSVLQILRHGDPVTFGVQGTGAVRMQMRVQLGVKMQIAECDLGGAAQCSRGLRHVSTPAWIKLAGKTISLRLRTVCPHQFSR